MIRASSKGRGHAIPLAVRHLNASVKRPIGEDEVRQWLNAPLANPAHDGHLRALLDEAAPELLLDLVLEREATYAGLASLADRLLPQDHPNRIWLDERRFFRTA